MSWVRTTPRRRWRSPSTRTSGSSRSRAIDDAPIVKSNVLLIGPTGCGKTLMCETLSRALGVPFVTAEATSLAQSRYVNDEIEAILQRLLEKAGGDVEPRRHGVCCAH